MQIKYYIKRAYGKEFLIIDNDEQRRAVQRLTKRMSVTESDRESLESLGITLKEIIKPINE